MCWTLNHQNIIEMAQGHISLSIGAWLNGDEGGRWCGYINGSNVLIIMCHTDENSDE
jgi:hypothetical protein